MSLRLRDLELEMMKEEVETLRRAGQGMQGAQGGAPGEMGAGETSRRSSWISRSQDTGQDQTIS